MVAVVTAVRAEVVEAAAAAKAVVGTVPVREIKRVVMSGVSSKPMQ
jgi:hypothetical protein